MPPAHLNETLIVHITVYIALSFSLCNYFTVTGTIILELHSNVCDYLYKNRALYKLTTIN